MRFFKKIFEKKIKKNNNNDNDNDKPTRSSVSIISTWYDFYNARDKSETREKWILAPFLLERRENMSHRFLSCCYDKLPVISIETIEQELNKESVAILTVGDMSGTAGEVMSIDETYVQVRFVSDNLQKFMLLDQKVDFVKRLSDDLRDDIHMNLSVRTSIMNLGMRVAKSRECAYAFGRSGMLRALRITPFLLQNEYGTQIGSLLLEYDRQYDQCVHAPPFMRDYTFLASQTEIMTLVNLKDGYVLEQNNASILFWGDFSNNHSQSIYPMLFSESPTALFDFEECISNNEEVKLWGGILKLKTPCTEKTVTSAYECSFARPLKVTSDMVTTPTRSVKEKLLMVGRKRSKTSSQLVLSNDQVRVEYLQMMVENYKTNEMHDIFHKVICVPIYDPVSASQSLMIIQNDISEEVKQQNRVIQAASRQLDVMEKMYPSHIIKSMLSNDRFHTGLCNTTSRNHDNVLVMFMDVCDFTAMSSKMSATDVLYLINNLFEECDKECIAYGMFNLDIVADCYICVGGLLKKMRNGFYDFVCDNTIEEDYLGKEAKKMIEMATNMLNRASLMDIKLRVGLHVGPVASGVVGVRSPKFTLLGDTMNTASRMESTGIPGWIQVSEDFEILVPGFEWDSKKEVEVKGKGKMWTSLKRVI